MLGKPNETQSIKSKDLIENILHEALREHFALYSPFRLAFAFCMGVFVSVITSLHVQPFYMKDVNANPMKIRQTRRNIWDIYMSYMLHAYLAHCLPGELDFISLNHILSLQPCILHRSMKTNSIIIHQPSQKIVNTKWCRSLTWSYALDFWPRSNLTARALFM